MSFKTETRYTVEDNMSMWNVLCCRKQGFIYLEAGRSTWKAPFDRKSSSHTEFAKEFPNDWNNEITEGSHTLTSSVSDLTYRLRVMETGEEYREMKYDALFLKKLQYILKKYLPVNNFKENPTPFHSTKGNRNNNTYLVTIETTANDINLKSQMKE